MIKTAYSIINGICEVTDKTTGIKISIPEPSKEMLKVSAVTNGVTGVSLVLFGLMTSYKWTIIVGGMGIASSILMKDEMEK